VGKREGEEKYLKSVLQFLIARPTFQILWSGLAHQLDRDEMGGGGGGGANDHSIPDSQKEKGENTTRGWLPESNHEKSKKMIDWTERERKGGGKEMLCKE